MSDILNTILARKAQEVAERSARVPLAELKARLADASPVRGFANALMLKDLKLAVEAAHGVDASVPMGAAAESLYQALVNTGAGAKDFSSMIRFLKGAAA